MTTHKKLPEVKQLLDDERSGKSSKGDRVKAFNDFKREGIAENSDYLIGEGLCAGQKVTCSGCSSFFKVVVAYWKVKTPCHAHGECIN